MANARGQYNKSACLSTPEPAGHSIVPWLLGAGFVGIGLTVLRSYAKREQPRLSAHEKEMRAWRAEFPGLPWYMDEVKDSCQLDMWERARDHWERTR